MKRFMKVVATTLCAGMVLSSGLFVTSPVVMAADGVAINSTNFPDANFRKYISEKIDSDSNGVLSESEIEKTNWISVESHGWHDTIYDLTGIEHFTDLSSLSCDGNELTKLDLSKNIKLRELYCSSNKLEKLDLSNNINLEGLYCSYNQLTSLDLSKNTNLVELICRENQIASLDLSKNTLLEWVDCRKNCLTSLDLNKNTVLKHLECCDNKLTSLNIDKCNNLYSVSCDNNQLANLNVVSSNLIYLSCENNQIASLNLNSLEGLRRLSCSNNKLTNLDISKNVLLQELRCDGNQLSELNLNMNPDIWYISCKNNNIKSLDLSKNQSLEFLDCVGNQLTDLDLSVNARMMNLYCNNNPIKSVVINNTSELYSYWKDEEVSDDYKILVNLDKDEYIVVTGVKAWVFYQHSEVWGALVIDPQSSLYANGELLYEPTNTPTPTPTNQPTSAPTSVPTVGPIPTAAPTTAPEQSVGSFVDRCYEVALGRAADGEGFKYWLDALNEGKVCGAQAGYGFIFSGEYINKNRTNEEFVTDLYTMYFGRTPDSEGFNYWVGLLNSGTDREEIFAGFANSLEFDNLCAKYGVVTGAYIVGVPNDQQGGVNAFVARLYQVCLNRLPDMGGQSGWVQKLIAGEVTGTTCAYGFVFSPEFIGKQPSNEEFVAYMYRAFFGREADEAGFTAWVSTLNGGGSYEDVFNGFTGSAEFANLCAGYGINP